MSNKMGALQRDPCGYLTEKPKRETNRKKHQPPFAVLSIAQKRPPVKASASFLPNDDVVFSLKTVPGWASLGFLDTGSCRSPG